MAAGGAAELLYLEYRRWRLQRLASMRMQELGLLDMDMDRTTTPAHAQSQAAATAATTAATAARDAAALADAAPPDWWPSWVPIRRYSATSDRVLLEHDILARRARVLALEEMLQRLDDEGDEELEEDASC